MTRQARRWSSLPVAVALIAFWWSAARPASAHEFTIVVVSARSADSADAGRGFKLAVDQSPDVSHAPGPDAGDHLGGVDVELVPVDDGENRGTADRVGDLLDDGASAVVVLLVPSQADGIAAAAAERGKLALVVGDDDASSNRGATLFLRPRSVGDADEVDVAAAIGAYQEALGDEPTRAALLGYDAGRLLDTIVAQVGHVLRPTRTLLAVAVGADAELTASRVFEAGAEVGDRDVGQGSSPGLGLSAAVAAAGLVGIGAVVVMMRRRPSQ